MADHAPTVRRDGESDTKKKQERRRDLRMILKAITTA
jgi:hypothetical protein